MLLLKLLGMPVALLTLLLMAAWVLCQLLFLCSPALCGCYLLARCRRKAAGLAASVPLPSPCPA